MSEIIDAALQKIDDEYGYFGAVDYLYTTAVANGTQLSGVKFSDEELADQGSQDYLSSLRQAAARIEGLGDVAVTIAGKGIVTVDPHIEDTTYADGSLTTYITLDQSSLSDGTRLSDVTGTYRDVFIRANQDSFGSVTVTPHLLVRNAQRSQHTVCGEGGVPLMAYGVQTFATLPLNDSVEIVVPRFETLQRYRRALGILAEQGARYPWFTDTAAHLIDDLENDQVDTAGRHVRQLGIALDQLGDRGVYKQGIEVLSGILCGNDVIVYGGAPEGSGYKHLVAKGSIIDVESNAVLDQTSIIVEASHNGQPSIHRLPMQSVISMQHID